MPGNVPLANATAVLPNALCTAFSAVREYAVQVNTYPDGTSQREIEVTSSRRRWALSRRLTPSLLTALREFFDARQGEAFFFYDPFESTPLFNYDPTGADPNGRFTVRFEGGWRQEIGLGRVPVDLQLVELAQSVTGGENLWFNAAAPSGHIVTAGF